MTIQRSPNLNSPMCFFLSFLSFVHICYSSATAPKLMTGFQAKVRSISFVGCMVQLFCIHPFGCTEIFVLTVMAYDRCVALRKPQCHIIAVHWKVCSVLVVTVGSGGLCIPLSRPSSLYRCPSLVPTWWATTSMMSALYWSWPAWTHMWGAQCGGQQGRDSAKLLGHSQGLLHCHPTFL